MRDILAHCPTFQDFTSGVRYAAELAAAFDACLTGLYVTAPLPLPPAELPASLTDEFLAFAHTEIERARDAQRAFEQWASGCGVRRSHWQLASGSVPRILASAGNANDLVVVEHRRRVPRECVVTVNRVLRSGVPCIVVPEARTGSAPPVLNHVAVAWNGSREAVRAVHGALPLLEKARRIFVLAAAPAPSSADLELSIEGYLAAHGLTAEFVLMDAVTQSTAQTILAAASAVAADLLVMGAFGTSRFHHDEPRGITQETIERSDMPLLLRH